MKRWFLVALAAVALAVSGCGSGGAAKQDGGGSTGMAESSRPSAAPQPASTGAPSQSKPAADSAAAPAPAPMTPVSSTAMPETLDRKMIMNAELDLRVKDADAAIDAVAASVRQSGGYVQETRQQGTRQQGRTIHMTLRVPSGHYDSIVSRIQEVSEEVLGRREWTNDVTAEYLDLEVRIKSRETHLDQLRRLYDRGGTIKELMELEQEIARVTADLESLKGRYRYLNNQVSFSTVIARFFEPGAPAPIKTPKSVWERMKLGFVSSWNDVINFTSNAAVFLVTILPMLLYIAILGLVLLTVLRLILRFRRKPPVD